MALDVILPWRDTGDAHRRAHFWHLKWHYGQQFNVIIGNNEGDFNRSAARNAGVNSGKAGVVAVIDADNLIDLTQLSTAAVLASRSERLVKPFTYFGYLDEATTNEYYLKGAIPSRCTWESSRGLVASFAGGAYVMRRDMWNRIGGFDEGFIGWGGEDDAFHIQAERTLGQALTVPGNNYHLWHPSTSRWTSDANRRRLMDRYVNGKGGQ